MGHQGVQQWKLNILIVMLIQLTAHICVAIKNEFLPISTLCPKSPRNFQSNIPVIIDGAVVTSHNERDLDCVVSFQTNSVLEMFMVRFEELKIDCNDQLQIFDGAHASGTPKAEISCDKTISSVGKNGVLFTRTNFLTIKYVTDSWGTDMNGFKIVITAFRFSHKKTCREGFLCDEANICINNHLVCDNVNHCGDGGDERASQFCTRLGVNALSTLDAPTLAAVVIGSALCVVSALTAYALYTCRKREQLRQEDLMMRQQTYEAAMSGNILSPALSREYSPNCIKILTCFLLI